jgi:hypothetical protein
MPFSCRIRCTTARCSDCGATRRATSQTVSPAPTRVTAVSAGMAGGASDAVRSRPPTTMATITAADATRLAIRPDRNAAGGALSASATAGASSRAGRATPRRVGRGRARAGGRLSLASLGTTLSPHVEGRSLSCAGAVIEDSSFHVGRSRAADDVVGDTASSAEGPGRTVGVGIRPAGWLGTRLSPGKRP